jgi:hypothetical protein
VGALYTPRTAVLIPTDGDSRPAPAASQRPVLAPGRTSHLPGSRLTRHQRGFKQFARPVFPSLWPPGWNGPPLDSCPGLRTPPTKSQRRTPRWGQAIEHGPGTTAQLTFPSISNPVVHSIRATSRRTSPKTSCVNLLGGVADGGLLSSAARSSRAGRPLGDCGAGHPLLWQRGRAQGPTRSGW